MNFVSNLKIFHFSNSSSFKEYLGLDQIQLGAIQVHIHLLKVKVEMLQEIDQTLDGSM